MKITFDWKNFESEKPEIGKTLIVYFPYIGNRGNLVLCKYIGERIEDKLGLVHYFEGSEISTKSLSKQSKLSYPVYAPKEYAITHPDFNPYNFEWDYYNNEWN